MTDKQIIENRLDSAGYYLINSAKEMALVIILFASFFILSEGNSNVLNDISSFWLISFTIAITPLILFFSSLINMVLFFYNTLLLFFEPFKKYWRSRK